jgi:hypothetical protein
VFGKHSSRPLAPLRAHAGSRFAGQCGSASFGGAIGAKAPFQPVLLAAPAVTPPAQRKAPKRRAPCEGSAFRLVCSCSVEWLQKSVAGAGSPQSLSVAAEREQRGLAPSGHPPRAKGRVVCRWKASWIGKAVVLSGTEVEAI